MSHTCPWAKAMLTMWLPAQTVSSIVGEVTMTKLKDLGFNSWQRQEVFFFCKMSRMALRTTQRPNKQVQGKVSKAWSWPFPSILCWDQEWMELYLCSPYLPPWCWHGQLYNYLLWYSFQENTCIFLTIIIQNDKIIRQILLIIRNQI
jgi:hypothetical protein